VKPTFLNSFLNSSFQQVPFNQSQIGIERHVCCINIVLTKIFVLYSAEDKQFAVTRGLNPPPYGTAGDCYSAQGKCPQGRFSINLQDTGIKLTSKVMWGSTGQAYSQIIYRYPEGLKVIGKCGGRCGVCSPESNVGLQIEMVKEDDT